VIIGRDILKFLKIDLRFSNEIIEWDGAEMPFEDGEASTKEACYVADSDPVEDAAHRVKHILDAKCDKAGIEKICEEQAEPDEQQQEQLAVLLRKCEAVFDGQLVLEDVCICNNGILEVSTSRSTASSSNSSNNSTTIISSKLIFCTKIDLFIQHLLEIIRRVARR